MKCVKVKVLDINLQQNIPFLQNVEDAAVLMVKMKWKKLQENYKFKFM